MTAQALTAALVTVVFVMASMLAMVVTTEPEHVHDARPVAGYDCDLDDDGESAWCADDLLPRGRR